MTTTAAVPLRALTLGNPAQALAAVIPYASREHSRYAIAGVYLDFPRGVAVATDGRRLALAPLCEPSPGAPSVVITAKCAAELAKRTRKAYGAMLEWSGTPGEDQSWSVDGFRLEQLEGTFVPYVDIMPPDDAPGAATATISDGAGFAAACSRLAKFIGDAWRPRVEVTQTGEKSLRLAYNTSEPGEAAYIDIPATFSGVWPVAYFNPAMLADVWPLTPKAGGEIRLQMTASNRPVLVSAPQLPGYRALIMPVNRD